MSRVARSIETLRVGAGHESLDVAKQQLYERWLKHDDWKARHEALPLVVGVDPERWDVYLKQHRVADAEQELWRLFADGNGIRADDAPVSVANVYAWFRNNDVELPDSFTRLYDFIRQTLLQPAAGDGRASEVERLAARELQEEKEIVLGAALSLVSKMPDRCRDEHGFIDGTAVSKLIVETAARWFPTAPPSMTETQMAQLIDKWLE